jgi:hypothetical protein
MVAMTIRFMDRHYRACDVAAVPVHLCDGAPTPKRNVEQAPFGRSSMEVGMRPISLYSVAAVVLPVALGLGLIYLYCVGRIGALAAVAAIMALGGLLVGGAFLSRAEGTGTPARTQ